jgi:hypothetical protein
MTSFRFLFSPLPSDRLHQLTLPPTTLSFKSSATILDTAQGLTTTKRAHRGHGSYIALACSSQSSGATPPELLEFILLEAVSDLKLQTIAITTGRSFERDPYRRFGRDSPFEIPILLAPRLVCRTMRDSSWVAVGAVIGGTIFDIRSSRRVENLVALSKCPNLVSWGENSPYAVTRFVTPMAAHRGFRCGPKTFRDFGPAVC